MSIHKIRQQGVALWGWITKPNHAIINKKHRQEAALFASLMAGLSPFAFLILVFWIIFNPNFETAPYISVATMLCLSTVYVLSRTVHYKYGVFLFVLMLVMVIVAVIITAPGPAVERMLAINFLVAAILVTSMILGVRETLIVGVISLLFTSAFIFNDDVPFSTTYAYIVYIVVMSALILIALAIRNNQLATIEQQNTTLEARQQRYLNVLHTIPDTVYTLDLEGETAPQFYKDEFLGYSRDELRSPASITEHLHPDDKAKVFQHWQDIQQQPLGSAAIIDYRVKSKVGEWEWIQMRSVVNAVNAAGKAKELLFVLTVITELKQSQQQAFEIAVQEERLDFLTNFVRGASHDLRTPLSSINASLFIFKNSDEAEQRELVLERLEQQVESLSDLVTNLFDLARLESGAQITMKPLRLNDIIQRICQNHQSIFDLKEIKLEQDLQDDLPRVQGAEAEIERVMSNLLGNAAQYTPNNGTVNLKSYAADGYVFVEVSDTGIGIGDDTLDRIFEPFFQTDEARKQGNNGSGVGLSVVKLIVEMHGGEIDVESTKGEGSLFRVKLPIEA